MMKRTKITLVAGLAALALAGIGTGAAFAAGGGTPVQRASLTASTAPASGSSTASPTAAPAGKRVRTLLARTEHGELTLRAKNGTRVVDVQRGTVTAVSPTSISVRSADGFTATYAVASTSKVTSKGTVSAIADVHAGDDVSVAALKNGGTDTVLHLRDAGPPKK